MKPESDIDEIPVKDGFEQPSTPKDPPHPLDPVIEMKAKSETNESLEANCH
jgi:hypothetical protein